MKKVVLLLFTILFITSCAPYSTYTEVYSEENIRPIFDIPLDFETEEARAETIKKYSVFYTGKKIFIDPGHGGEDHRGQSKSGRAVEAEVNLRVGLFLREYLEEAGAEVIMSRDDDATVELKERSEMANESGADFFISIHHNAPGKDNYRTNYTSTFYHAKETDYEYDAYEHEMARYIQRDLAYVMRNSGGLGSFDGTYSDYIIYPGEGFSVLRKTEIPAVLLECSFFTNPFEEERIIIDYFNSIQAWGVFRGLGKFLQHDYPKISLDPDLSTLKMGELDLFMFIENKSKIDGSSINVFIDSVKTEYFFDPVRKLLRVERNDLGEGEYSLSVVCKNEEGLPSIPFRKKLKLEYTD
ncbi:MAG: N-acetylmuramoyl-L-alanine amidase [Melioribacteraceae bacterium]|nr:N-acetylmuramoyl-L-alanine amidase [Melioribacteraceae bacterium]